jgi:hypothetical protein
MGTCVSVCMCERYILKIVLHNCLVWEMIVNRPPTGFFNKKIIFFYKKTTFDVTFEVAF